MPDVAITAPVAADSIDRLALGVTDARMSRNGHAALDQALPAGACCANGGWFCMAED